MTQNQLLVYKGMLENKLRSISFDREGLQLAVCPEKADETCFRENRDMNARTAEQTCRCRKQVQSALRRIEQGSYGICCQCEDDITQTRLNALPWAALCVSCQQEEERSGKNTIDATVR